jgi:TonB family protein
VSRSLVLAFVIAIILHALLAGVELNIFKGPLRVSNVPKALTLDLIKPSEAKKPSKAEKPPVLVRKPDKAVRETAITKKLKPKPKPTMKTEKPKTHLKRLLPKKEPAEKTEALARLKSSEIPREKEEKGISERDYGFAPDVVDASTALPKEKDSPPAGEEDRSPLTPPDEHITFATPNYKRNSPPKYPLLARRKNYEGTVLLEVLVRTDGTVGSIKLARSSGHETLDQSAIRGVRKWTFHPGKRGDEELEMWVTIPIRFQLK